jgi:4'-phosphopantetheinyl transferase
MIPPLTSNSIHVWTWRVTPCVAVSETPSEFLSWDECDRATRFKRDCDRQRYIAIRLWLRHLLAEYLAVEPQAVVFDYLPKGKPIVPKPHNPENLQFNLSHSGDWAIVALTPGAAVGVDVEQWCPKVDPMAIAKRFFTPLEYEMLQREAMPHQVQTFFRLWTRKEASIKALGQSLFEQIQRLEVPLHPQDCGKWMGIQGGEVPLFVQDVPMEAGYTAAIACTQPERIVVVLTGQDIKARAL